MNTLFDVKKWVTPSLDYAEKLKHLTAGKAYEIIRIDNGGNIYIIGDDGLERPHTWRQLWVTDSMSL